MMKRKWEKILSGSLAVLLATAPALQASSFTAQAAKEENVYTISAPTENLQFEFWLNETGTPMYRVVRDGMQLIEDAKLGLNTSLGALNVGFTLSGEPVESSGDNTWEPLVGEQAVIRDCYNETVFTLLHEETNLEIDFTVRAYDEGVAFRYVLPEIGETGGAYTISDEYTQFVFPAGTTASLHVGGNQTVPKKYTVENLPSGTIQRPATMEYADGQMLTICEGNLDNYSVMTMEKGSQARTLEAKYAGRVTVDERGNPHATPWRVFVIGDSPTELLKNDTIIQNLNEPADEDTYRYSEWVDPGTCVRATTGLNNTAIKEVIDIASAHGIRYVLLDSGWYGPEYDTNADPRLSPADLDPNHEKDKILLEKYYATEGGYQNTGEGVFNTRGNGFNQYGQLGDGGSVQVNVDIPALCAYGKERNVGILLYVNGVFFPDKRERFDADALFSYYEKWGVAGVKPGFVKVRTQENERLMEEVIEAAAKHKLVMTIHDEYVPTGLERTYPNLMMTEGILGDEGIGRNGNPQIAEDIATVFTRNVQGPPDHTFSYPGKGTKAYALASPILFRSGMSVIYWYTNPSKVPPQDMGKMGIWDDMPTTWEESLFLEGSLYEYATTARRSADDVWYVGSLSAIDRTLELSLDFLNKGITYVADVYADGHDADPYAGWTTDANAAKSKQTLENKKYLVTSDTVLKRDLKYGFGYAVVLKKATDEDLTAYPVYNVYREILGQEIVRAEKIMPDGYTIDSWTVFEAARNEAKEIAGNPKIPDEQVIEATEALKAAREGLISTELLDKAIDSVKYYTSYHYTKASYSVLEQAVEDAKALLDGGQYTQAQLNEAKEAIETAIEGLKIDANRILKSTTYLDELDYDTERSYAHAGAIKKKQDYYGSSLSLMIDGQEKIFEHGMMTHAQSEVFYNIEGRDFEVFEAYVGVDTVKNEQGNVIFKVFGDDELLYESAPSGNGSQNAQFLSVPIAGVKELRIEANMNGSNDGDHAVWADAKFLVYRNPDAYLAGITVDGKEVQEFRADEYNYFYQAAYNSKIPEVDVVLAEDDVTYEIEKATHVPGCTKILVNTRDGGKKVYKVYFLPTEDSDYISDMQSLITKNTLYGLTKDKAHGGAELAITAADGKSKLSFNKGLGTHASSSTDSMVVYDISGKNYDIFTGYVGISYTKNDARAKVNFKVFVDDETVPRFESGVMEYRTPAIRYSVEVRGAKTLKLVVDACKDQSADHGCWCDAKFLTYTGIQKVTGCVNPGKTGADVEGIAVELYEVVGGKPSEVPIETVCTDENGEYTFAAVISGKYVVKIAKDENYLETSVEVVVGEENVTQNFILKAPEFAVNIIQPEDAIVVVNHANAVKDETITIYVKEITEGKVVSAVNVTTDDGIELEVTAVEDKAGEYTFTMPKQEVIVQVTLADDEKYLEAVKKAGEMDEKILAVGEVTLEKREQIESLRAEYEQLGDEVKEHVQEIERLERYEYLLEVLEIEKSVEKAEEAAKIAKTAAEEAALSAAEDKAAAEEAKLAAEAAREQAEEAKKSAEAAQKKSEEAKKAAEEAALSTAEDKLAAEEAKKSAEAAKKAAQEAQAQAEEAQEATETAEKKAEEAQVKAERAQAEAEVAQEKAEEAKKAAQAAAEAAEQSNKEAAQAARKAAEAAKNAAQEHKEAAVEAGKAAKEAVQAAKEARRAASEAAKAVKAAESAVEAAESAAEAQAKAQEAQEKAEEAQKAAEEAEKKAEEERKAAEEARKKAEEERKAAEEARKAAELATAKQEAMITLSTDRINQKKLSPAQKEAYDAAFDEALFAISNVKEEKEIQKILTRWEEAKKAVEESISANQFEDVKETDWFYDVVDYVAFNEWMTGLDDTHFAPGQVLCRAQFALVLYRMQGQPEVTTDKSFADVDVDSWYGNAVLWAAENEIVTGYDNGNFGPADMITREQMAVMMYRYAKYLEKDTEAEGDLTVFEDAGKISGFAEEAMVWAVGEELITGTAGGTKLNPQGCASRAEAATILVRFLTK